MKNEMILASAGSGKTWQLTNRYIAIMARAHLAGEEPRPDQIVAVTFTRKAAGEFFDEILKKLAQGARSDKAAAKLAGPPNDPENPFHDTLSQLTALDYQALLACFIRRMPGLFLGTLDSFFSRIVRAFPTEFGLTGDFEIIDEHAASRARSEVFRRVFQESTHRPEATEFIEAFRLATFGKEESSIQYLLDRYVNDHHHILLSAASAKLWGQADAIWPEGCEWLDAEGDDTSDLEQLFSLFTTDELTEKQWIFWNEFQDQLLAYRPGEEHPKRIKDLLGKFLANWPAVKAGEAAFAVGGKKQEFSPAACAIISRITRRLVSHEIKTKLVRTHGIWLILSEYEHFYSQLVRRRGRLTFHDMQVILAGTSDAPAPILSQRPDVDTRLRIDYRLDATYHHWLLDEFQDTSHLQWTVIANLIDEAMQDPSGDRSLFQVGDVKQAIYAWRGGDTRLFRDISDRYSDIGPRSLGERGLDVSWRSGRDVIEPLNAIFGNKAAIANLKLPQEALDRWQWRDHQVAAPNQDRIGYTGYYQPKRTDGEKPDKEDVFALTLALLEEIQPLKKGLSCAVLVQGNPTGRALVDYIREHSTSKFPVVSESDVPVAIDNPVTQAFLALFRLAAHPQDTFSEQHLAMSPLGALLEKNEIPLATLPKTIRAQVHEFGFEKALLHWIKVAEEGLLLADPFARQRLHELSLAARIFDAGGSLSLDEFLSYTESYQLREAASQAAVQVMTIHKSKGLTFDMVILPQLDGNALTTKRTEIAVKKRGQEREAQWVLDLPKKDIAQADPVLAEHHTHLEAEASYEQLCKFYVALTRARYANYLIALPRGKKSVSNNFIKLLDETLENEGDGPSEEVGGVPYQVGYESDLPTSHRDWWQQIEKEAQPEAKEELIALPKLQARVRPSRRTPSRNASDSSESKQLFSRSDSSARELGTTVHALFQALGWDLTSLPPSENSEALAQLTQVLADPDCRAALAEPTLSEGETATLWREQNFEVLLDGRWTSGIIDRAIVINDAEGTPVSARIIDYKTDLVSSPSEADKRARSYQSQIETYRQATALLLGLPLEKISAQLLFTRLPLLVEA